MKTLSSKISAAMLVIGFLGVYVSARAGIGEGFKAYERQNHDVSLWSNIGGYASLLLFFGGALLYIVDWMRAKVRKP